MKMKLLKIKLKKAFKKQMNDSKTDKDEKRTLDSFF